MARGRSTKIISMIKWIRTSRLSIKISLSSPDETQRTDAFLGSSSLREFYHTIQGLHVGVIKRGLMVMMMMSGVSRVEG